MFSLMGNCVSCIKKRQEPKRPITLAILGLDCAGKTTTAKVFTGEPLDDDIAPTVGFSSEKFTLGKFDITMFDLGGGKQIRAVWTTYLAEVYGIIYMIDSTAAERMEELKNNFRELVENRQVAGKPVLVFANKQDKENALDEMDILEQVNLEHIVNIQKCPCRVESCSAIKGSGRKMDPTLKEGMQWLCDIIEKNFDTLKARVVEDMAVAEEERKIEAAARKERVRKIREERERKEEEERKKMGIEKKPESDDEDFINGDPFKRIDVAELERKEAMMKEEKKKKKKTKSNSERKTPMTKNEDLDESEYLRTPQSNRTYGLSPLGHELGEKSADDSDSIIGSSTSRSRRMLPPLQQPLGTKFMEESTTTKKKKKKKVKQNNAYTENDVNGSQNTVLENPNMLEYQEQKSMRSVSKISVTTKSFVDGSEDNMALSSHRLTPLDGEEDVFMTKGSRRPKGEINGRLHNNSVFELQDVSSLAPVSRPLPQRNPSLDLEGQNSLSETGVKKKKKKKPKRNQLSPSGQTGEELDVSSSSKRDYSGHNYPWDKPNPLMDGSDQDDTGLKHQTSDFSTKWGFVEDLPEVADSGLRSKPNYDDDDDIIL